MGCGTSKHAVAPVPVTAPAAAPAPAAAAPADAAPVKEPPVADAVQTITPGGPAQVTTDAASAETPAQISSSEPAAIEKQDDALPGAVEEKAKAAPSPTDEERSNTTTPAASEVHSLGATSPRIEDNVEKLPDVAVPFPTPTDVDAIKLPSADPNELPYWERKDPLPARPGTGSRRPGSSAGKIVVYKTAKTKKMEEEGRKKRQQDGEVIPVPHTPSARPSALPPLKERKKKSKRQLDATLVESPAKPATADWHGTNNGEAWSLDATEFVTPTIAEDGEVAAAVPQTADVISFD